MKSTVRSLVAVYAVCAAVGVYAELPAETPEDFYVGYRYEGPGVSDYVGNFLFKLTPSGASLTVNSFTDEKGTTRIDSVAMYAIDSTSVDKIYNAVRTGEYFDLEDEYALEGVTGKREISVTAAGDDKKVTITGSEGVPDALTALEEAVLAVIDETRPGWRKKD